MSLVRNLANDLVQKRLWPIAVALVVAIVAVPLLLAGGGSTSSSSPAPATGPGTASAPGAVPAAARVTLDSTPTARRYRAGRVRNPFRQVNLPEPEVATAAGATGASSAAGSTTSGGSTSVGNTVSDTLSKVLGGGGTAQGKPKVTEPTVTPVAKPVTTASTAARYRVAWRFGGLEGARKSNHDAARLTALPSPSSPIAQFLGILEDHRTVVFLLRPGATVAGEARCLPTLAECHLIEMRRRDVVDLSYTDAAGIVQRYRLGVSNVERRTVSKAAALRSYRRVSKAGRELLSAAVKAKVPGTGEHVYLRRKGLLKPVD